MLSAADAAGEHAVPRLELGFAVLALRQLGCHCPAAARKLKSARNKKRRIRATFSPQAHLQIRQAKTSARHEKIQKVYQIK